MKKALILCFSACCPIILLAQNFLNDAYYWVLPYELNLFENNREILETDEIEFHLKNKDTVFHRREIRKFDSDGKLVERQSSYHSNNIIHSWTIEKIECRQNKIHRILTLYVAGGKTDTFSLKRFEYSGDLLKTVVEYQQKQSIRLVFTYKQGYIEQKTWSIQGTEFYIGAKKFLVDDKKRLKARISLSILDNKTVTEKESYFYDKNGCRIKYLQEVGEKGVINNCAIYTYDQLKRNNGLYDCGTSPSAGFRYTYTNDGRGNWVLKNSDHPGAKAQVIRKIIYRKN